jgi:hypothetical protein
MFSSTVLVAVVVPVIHLSIDDAAEWVRAR